jgi:lambda family phage tail tape measure protein
VGDAYDQAKRLEIALELKTELARKLQELQKDIKYFKGTTEEAMIGAERATENTEKRVESLAVSIRRSRGSVYALTETMALLGDTGAQAVGRVIREFAYLKEAGLSNVTIQFAVLTSIIAGFVAMLRKGNKELEEMATHSKNITDTMADNAAKKLARAGTGQDPTKPYLLQEDPTKEEIELQKFKTQINQNKFKTDIDALERVTHATKNYTGFIEESDRVVQVYGRDVLDMYNKLRDAAAQSVFDKKGEESRAAYIKSKDDELAFSEHFVKQMADNANKTFEHDKTAAEKELALVHDKYDRYREEVQAHLTHTQLDTKRMKQIEEQEARESADVRLKYDRLWAAETDKILRGAMAHRQEIWLDADQKHVLEVKRHYEDLIAAAKAEGKDVTALEKARDIDVDAAEKTAAYNEQVRADQKNKEKLDRERTWNAEVLRYQNDAAELLATAEDDKYEKQIDRVKRFYDDMIVKAKAENKEIAGLESAKADAVKAKEIEINKKIIDDAEKKKDHLLKIEDAVLKIEENARTKSSEYLDTKMEHDLKEIDKRYDAEINRLKELKATEEQLLRVEQARTKERDGLLASPKEQRESRNEEWDKQIQDSGNFVDGFTARIRQLEEEFTNLGKIGANTASALVDGMTDAFMAFASGSATASQAIKQFAKTFILAVTQMITKALILKAINTALGLGGGGGSSGGSTGGFGTAGDGVGTTGGGTSPGYAEGGIVTRRHRAWVGENGPEAIVPLSGGRHIPVKLQGGGRGDSHHHYNIEFTVVATDAKSFRDQLSQQQETVSTMFVDAIERKASVRSRIKLAAQGK